MKPPRALGACWIGTVKYIILLLLLLTKVTAIGAFKSENHRPRLKCTKCQPGYEVVKYCTETRDTVCQKCSDDKFSPRASRWHHCRDCKKCANDEYLTTPCTATANAICSPCDTLGPSTTREALQDYLSKCQRKLYRHGSSMKKKPKLKRSNPAKGDATTVEPGKKKDLDGPQYTVFAPVIPERKAPEKKEDPPPMAAAAPGPAGESNSPPGNQKDGEGEGPIIFISIGAVLAIILILIAVFIYVGRKKGLFGKRHMSRKGSDDIEEQHQDEKPHFLPEKMPSAEPLRDDMEPLVIREIAPNPVMSAPPQRGRTHIPNGTIQINLANGPGVRPFGSEDFPFIDDDVEDDIYPRGRCSPDSEPRTKSLDRENSSNATSPAHPAPFNSLPFGVSPAGMRSYEEPKDVFEGRLSPCHSTSSHSSCYSLHSRHKDETDGDQDEGGESSPLLRSRSPYFSNVEDLVRAEIAQPEMAPLLSSSPNVCGEEDHEVLSSEGSEGADAHEGTYLYAKGDQGEAMILDDDVEPRTLTELERQFDQMAADWAAFNQDNQGMGTCIIFEDPSLETIPESPEFSYNSAENSVLSFGANSNDQANSDTSGDESITKRIRDSDSSSSGNIDCVAEFKTGPDRDFLRTPSPDLDAELNAVPQVGDRDSIFLNAVPQVGDRDSMFLEEDAVAAQLQEDILTPTNPQGAPTPVMRESADSTRTSDSLLATNMEDIQQYLGSSTEDEIFIPQVQEPGITGCRNETVTSTDLERQLSSIPALQESDDNEVGSDDAFHPNDSDNKDTGARGFNEKPPLPIPTKVVLHISSSESSSSNSESSSDESSSDDVGNNENGVGLIFENKMVYR
ncbi:dentin sialophosphoprotein-like [Lineus longissimus]|uniref:dentin sialophosphoprotein-like n=1 Tax=Lineus longissimus TaxID=88925 RepID=UPI002B4E1CDB